MDVPFSVLDLAPVPAGTAASTVVRRTNELAQLAERRGFLRCWFAEHHSMPSIASAATEILIANAAAATETIRVGAGGVMLPNHVPLQVAERFHTLEALYPGRIDLGLGRAPGTDPITSRALRSFDAEHFPDMVAEMRAFSMGAFPDDHPLRNVRAVPMDVSLPPIWILGSSGASAQYAGKHGFGYGFARHFSPSPPEPALAAYREHFEPSETFERPHVILAVSVICAETDEEAEHLAATLDLAWVRMRTNNPAKLPSPEEAKAYDYSPQERAIAEKARRLHFIGSPSSVRQQLEGLVEETEADELMITSLIYDHEARLRSYELLADAVELEPAEHTAEPAG